MYHIIHGIQKNDTDELICKAEIDTQKYGESQGRGSLVGCHLWGRTESDTSTLAWKIPWMEEPGGLQYMGLLNRTQLSDFTFTFHFHALEKEMATHSSVLAWRISGMGELGGVPSMGSHRVGHD